MQVVTREGGFGTAGGLITDAETGPGFDASECAVRPGRICAHTHLYSGLAPLGMPAPEDAPENFVEILERVWWRLDRALTAETLRASARLYVAESLLLGTTTLIDHHESPLFIEGSLDVLASACTELGMRAVLTYGATERNDGRAEAKRGLTECQRFIEANTSELLVGMVGLHAAFTVSDDTLRDAAALCAQLGAKMHVHVAEDGADVADSKARGYAGPFERLQQLGALPSGSILAHGVHLSPAQIEAVEAAGHWLVHNPRSNAGNQVGYGQHLGRASRVALGTDGYPADMIAECQALATLGAEFGDTPERAETRLNAGRELVAELFGVPFEGTAGSAADLIFLSADAVKPRHVMVGGALVVRDGALVHGDIDAIRAEAAAAATKLWRAMAQYSSKKA